MHRRAAFKVKLGVVAQLGERLFASRGCGCNPHRFHRVDASVSLDDQRYKVHEPWRDVGEEPCCGDAVELLGPAFPVIGDNVTKHSPYKAVARQIKTVTTSAKSAKQQQQMLADECSPMVGCLIGLPIY